MRSRVLGLIVALATALPFASLAGDGVVALQTADPSCADDSGNRYVDCGNGTVTDSETGLIWLRQANCLAKCSDSPLVPCTVNSDCPEGETCDLTAVDWRTAMEFVAGLSDKPETSAAAAADCGLSDGSSPGEWRLPSVEEWEATIEYADEVLGCIPTITNDAGDECWSANCFLGAGGCSLSGVQAHWYWTATSSFHLPDWAWMVNLLNGSFLENPKSPVTIYVWPVRGGQ